MGMVLHRETVAYASQIINLLACAGYIGLALNQRNALSLNHGQGQWAGGGEVTATVTKLLQHPLHTVVRILTTCSPPVLVL